MDWNIKCLCVVIVVAITMIDYAVHTHTDTHRVSGVLNILCYSVCVCARFFSSFRSTFWSSTFHVLECRDISLLSIIILNENFPINLPLANEFGLWFEMQTDS